MIQIHPDYESLSQAAAALFVSAAQSAIDRSGRFTVALSGGSTPCRTYRILADRRFRERLDWRRVVVFWGDERCVSPDDPESNEHMARQALLDHVPIPPGQVHPMRCAPSPEQAARRYEALVKSWFKPPLPTFDLVLLGLGEDGHTASLFPGGGAVGQDEQWVAAVVGAPGGLVRVTLSAAVINRARKIVFLVQGARKADILQAVLEGPSDPRLLPAQRIRPEAGELIWLVDRPAAKWLRFSRSVSDEEGI